MAAILNIKTGKATDKTITINKKDGDGVAVNIDGWTFWITAKNNADDTDDDAVFQKSVVASGDDAIAGIAKLELTNENTNIDAKTYYYDVKQKNLAGKITIIMRGVFEIYENITDTQT